MCFLGGWGRKSYWVEILKLQPLIPTIKEFAKSHIECETSESLIKTLGRGSSRNPEVLLAQIDLPLVVSSCDLLGEDEACCVHVHRVAVGSSKVNQVPFSFLWQGGCVKKCSLPKQNKRTLFIILTIQQPSQEKPSAKELACVDARKLKSLDQRRSSVEFFHQVVSCQLEEPDPTSEPTIQAAGTTNDEEW